jgi:Uri superfamily endonuclease
MVNYQEGKIYTIRNYMDDTLIYVGSTTRTLSQRIAEHRSRSKDEKKISLSYIDDDWSNWYIELYENYPCNNKSELCKREGEIIREIGSINYQIAGRTSNEYYEDNKEIISQKGKNYYENNKEIILQRQKKYQECNKEVLCNRFKEWYDKNKSLVLEPRKDKCVCDICGCNVSKVWLRKHKKTKKCMTIKKLPIIMENP